MSNLVRQPKRLIEVELPIKRISAHARREKSLRHGNISTMHIWWARRPLAACRAITCASLWLDPADPYCPESFRQEAKKAILNLAKHHLDQFEGIAFDRFVKIQKNNDSLNDNLLLRTALLDLIAEFSNPDKSSSKQFIECSSQLTKMAHVALGGSEGTRPLVIDPFAGGGSIPFEALRVGADVFATDLNPVPVLLNKVALEYIPKFGNLLESELRKWGKLIKSNLIKDINQFFPSLIPGEIPIAYIWSRTIQCEGPSCGTVVPMLRSLWLGKKSSRPTALQLNPMPQTKEITFEIIQKIHGHWHNKHTGKKLSGDPNFEGTVKRGSVTCPCCGFTTPVARVREQLKSRQGGVNDARLICIVSARDSEVGRFYRIPEEIDIKAINQANAKLINKLKNSKLPMNPIPDETLPLMSGVFNVPIYGHNTWGSLFTSRQSLVLLTLVEYVLQSGEVIKRENGKEFADAVQTMLAFAVDRAAEHLTSLCRWNSTGQKMQATFGRQALPIVFDFCEANPCADSVGAWDNIFECVMIPFETAKSITHQGTAVSSPAQKHPLPDDSANAFITDPPYYNAVPYADLSDFFYVWLKRTLFEVHPGLFADQLSPKTDEACEMSGWDPIRYPHKNALWYEQQMMLAMREARRVVCPSGIGIVVFAHKTTAGWEAVLKAMLDSGWVITGSWPIDTEMGSRLRALDSAALGSSVHLVCRPRENADGSLREDEIGDWRDVLQELPVRIHEWMPHLAEEGVVGADAIFACLGPALEIFSRYSRVEKASGEPVSLREYLEQVWAAVSREALSMIFQGANTEGFEPDARLTAMWLWTLSTDDSVEVEGGDGDEIDGEESEEVGKKKKISGFLLDFDAARKIAQGLGASLEDSTSLVHIDGDVAKLLSVAERAAHLFGKEAIQPSGLKSKGRQKQQALPGFEEIVEEVAGFGLAGGGKAKVGQTVLDRVHQSMLLFGAGRSEAMKAFLVDEGVGRDARFWRLAQAFSALYPRDTQEKRWVDGVLARKKSLGF